MDGTRTINALRNSRGLLRNATALTLRTLRMEHKCSQLGHPFQLGPKNRMNIPTPETMTGNDVGKVRSQIQIDRHRSMITHLESAFSVNCGSPETRPELSIAKEVVDAPTSVEFPSFSSIRPP
jgi:hypothetical protein